MQMPLWAQDHVIRVSLIPDLAPHSYLSTTGEPAGIYVDLFRIIASNEGWDYEFVIGDWSDNYNAALAGDIDLLIGVNMTEERRAVLDFTEIPVINNWAQIITRSNRSFETILDLEGKNIGLMTGDQNGMAFIEYADEFDITYQKHYFPNYSRLYEAIDENLVDAGVMESNVEITGYRRISRTSIIFNPTSGGFAVMKGRNSEILSTIDSYLATWTGNSRSIYYRLLDEYAGIRLKSVQVLPHWVTPVISVIIAAIVISIVIIRLLTIRLTRANDSLTELNSNLEEQVRIRGDKLKQSMEEVMSLEKMASLGRMVAGIAHEINTPLGVAVTASSFLKHNIQTVRDEYQNSQLSKEAFDKHLDASEETTELLEANLRRASGLIQSFKEISIDRHMESPRPINLEEYGKDIVDSLSPFTSRKRITVNLAAEDIYIQTFPGSISQIITALIHNSVEHAFAENQSGTIDVSLRVVEGPVIEVVVIDDGCGIDESIRDMIFEPFITTARESGSTGLGLNVVFTLVKDHLRGEIAFTTGKDGTSFVINIPAQF